MFFVRAVYQLNRWLRVAHCPFGRNQTLRVPSLISIACMYKGKLVHGVVVDPMRQKNSLLAKEVVTLNGKRIRVSASKELKNGSVAGPLPSRNGEKQLKKELTEIGRQTYGLGSVALDLAYVASGKIDCLWRNTADIEAIAAGIILVKKRRTLRRF